MSNLKQLEQKYEELGREIEALKVKSNQPDILWKPEKGEQYHFLKGKCEDYYSWDGGQTDSGIFAVQQLFKTLEEVEFADRQRIAKMRVLRRVAELNHELGWVCEFIPRGGNSTKFVPRYEWHSGGCVIVESWNSSQRHSTDHYAAKHVWEQVIQEMGADVKFGLWGIE